MDKQQQEEMAKTFFECVEGIQAVMEVVDGKKHEVKFFCGNCGIWSIKFIPKTERQAINT